MKIFLSAMVVFAILCGSATTYAGTLEGERAASGVKFGEPDDANASSAVKMSGEFTPGPKAAFTAGVTKKSGTTPVPPVGNPAPAKDKLGKGANAGVTIGVIAGALGGSILTWGLAGAVGGPLGIAVLAVVKIAIAIAAGCLIGGFLGKVIGGLFDKNKKE